MIKHRHSTRTNDQDVGVKSTVVSVSVQFPQHHKARMRQPLQQAASALLIFLCLSHVACNPVPHTCPEVVQAHCSARSPGISLISDAAAASAVIAATPLESTAQQEVIIARLKALAAADTADEPHNSTTAAATSEDAPSISEAAYSMEPNLQAQQQTLPIHLETPNPADSYTASTADAVPAGQISSDLTYLQNRNYKIGIDLKRAGVITWISSPRIPGPMRNQNLINTWDAGRLLQQSFYGCPDGSCWATKPWVYNPVQAGSWTNQPSVTTKHVVSRNNIYVEGHPRNWGGGNVIDEVTFCSNITLKRDYIQISFTVHYKGRTAHRLAHQEVPAVFLQRGLSVLTYYADNKPWTQHNNVTYAFPGFPNVYAKPTETWAAYLDPNTGWGLGLYNPKATTGITAYRVGPDGSTAASDCSYFSPLITAQLVPGMKDYSYTAMVAIGSMKSMRRTFTKIEHNRRRLRGGVGAAGDEDVGVAAAGASAEQQVADEQQQKLQHAPFQLQFQDVLQPEPGHNMLGSRLAEYVDSSHSLFE